LTGQKHDVHRIDANSTTIWRGIATGGEAVPRDIVNSPPSDRTPQLVRLSHSSRVSVAAVPTGRPQRRQDIQVSRPSTSRKEVDSMPKNRLMYIGIILIVAAASLWAGAELTRRTEWMVPYLGVGGILLVVLGVVLEFWNSRTVTSHQ